MQIDVGFGDVVTPTAQTIKYPALLEFPVAELPGYPRETVVAEKFQAIVYLRTANSRMKDFYDVWLLASQFPFDGNILADAISATFKNRGTEFDLAPIAFNPEFTEQTSALAQWRAFRARLSNETCPERLSEVVTFLARFLLPVVRASAESAIFPMKWSPQVGWRASKDPN
jgi:hypothetical protein